MDMRHFCTLVVLVVLTCVQDGPYLASATHAENYTEAATHMLNFYGINDTSLLPGQVYCPQMGALNDSYKQNTIYVGVLACRLDPLFLSLTSDQRFVLAGHNSSEEEILPGYYPPIPG